MTKNEATWDVVVVDPPKLVFGKGDEDEGMRKYEDLNRLAATLVRPGGLLVTCSCSGKVTESDFEKHACRGIHRAGRRFQILDRTGAGPDHPIYSNCPEGRYLKVIWGRILKP
jgi:23S rRNA (cytosine1962-C5)-methyltransferase